MQRLIIITGQEGSGKTTIIRALLPHTPNSARIDAEDLGQTNPWKMDDHFIKLLWRNVLDLTNNFWEAGYSNVIAGSFLNTYDEYKEFRKNLPEDTKVFIIQLCASGDVRDTRRIKRKKPTKKEWRDIADAHTPQDETLKEATGEYKFIRIDNSNLTVEETVSKIKEAISEIYN